MPVGELADLLTAIALCVLVALAVVPLIKAGRALGEIRTTTHGLGHNSVPVLVELKSTVGNTNAGLEKLSLVTDDMARASRHAIVISEHAANLLQLFVAILGNSLVRGVAIAHGLRTASKGRKK